MANLFSLENKKILITGATSGIGRATAEVCAGLGAEVIVTGRNEERLQNLIKLLNDKWGKCAGLVADLISEDDLNALVESVSELSGLVLCAGVNDVNPIKFATRKKIDRLFETNFFSQIELLRSLLKKKKLGTGASVVAVSSIGGVDVFSIGQAAYGASKAALLSWMKYAAKELAFNKIRVNCVLPGHIETPMNEKLAFTAEQLVQYKETIPLKRFGTAEDVANGIVYLLSDAASWVTGSTLKIDGGSTL